MSHSAQQRKQKKPRAPRKDTNRTTLSGGSVVTPTPDPRLSPRAAAFRARRGGSVAQASAFTISRAQEMMYIREDLRRLVYIAGGLLVLMLAILYLLER